MARCAYCDSSLDEGALVCGVCGREQPPPVAIGKVARELEQVAEPASAPPAAAAQVPPAAAEPTPPGLATVTRLPPGNAPRCAVHADEPSKVTCPRCGRFTCERCLLPQRFVLDQCVDCVASFYLAERLKKQRRRRMAFTVTMMVANLPLLFVAVFFTIEAWRSESLPMELGIAATLLIAGSLLGLLRFQMRNRPLGAVASIVLVGLAGVMMLGTGSGLCCGLMTLVVVGRAVYELWQINRVDQLAAEIARMKAGTSEATAP